MASCQIVRVGPVLAFGDDNFGGTHAFGCQCAGEIGDEIMNLRAVHWHAS